MKAIALEVLAVLAMAFVLKWTERYWTRVGMVLVLLAGWAWSAICRRKGWDER